MNSGLDRIQHLINSVVEQFNSRIENNKDEGDLGVSISVVKHDNTLWLSFTRGQETHSATAPLPFEERGVKFIRQNEVLRALCPFWMEDEQREIDYVSALYRILLGNPVGLVQNKYVKPTPYFRRVLSSFAYNNTSVIIYTLQRAINEVVSKMPLHETMMNSFVMNNRLMIIDHNFDEISSPNERLVYQTNKARKYFDKGWTSIGLADGGLADKNYILKVDLRNFSPFGIRYHNPKRNLYSTLGMKGDELPNIRSRSMQNLMDAGITRKGWNLFTAFIDIPDTFEDQIMVDKSHKNKFVEYKRRYQVFGTLAVGEGQSIRTGDVLGIAPDDERTTFKVLCDSAKVQRVAESVSSVGGIATRVYNIVVSYKRSFCDGFKLTNLHGNKGIIRFANLGYATDPRTGKQRKIDVIVGAKTVGKRCNYGQVMEALMNCIIESDVSSTIPVVLPDDWNQNIDEVTAGLERRGYRSGGTWDCHTYACDGKAVCGTVFWGCIKTPHDQIWSYNATINRNNKEIRTAGLKFSHVEFRSLETRFGVDNPIASEIMSYVQGTENTHEMIYMLRSKIGEYPPRPALNINSVSPMDQTNGTIVPEQCIHKTVVDEFFYPDGFLFELPIPYQTLVDKEEKIAHEGSPLVYAQLPEVEKANIDMAHTTSHLYFPSGTLRKCWRHDTGKFGLSEIGVLVNNVVMMSTRLVNDFNNPALHRLYYDSIFRYFNGIASMMGTKHGDIATMGMAVRYPFSVKAVASLSTTLHKNTVEIHRDMARTLHVKTGDVVITERFPCLGFMSIRPQKVHVTDDPMCKYVIRVSGNSLVSQNLDFDGDVLFMASFHTPEAKEMLRREWENPNRTCYREIKALNERKGAPHTKEYNLLDIGISPFNDLTCDSHASIVEKNTGVKAQTGPVIALTYNLMRIVENSDLAKDQKMKVAVEMFLEKAAQSVFEQKHGGKSLYEIVIDGICEGNVELLVSVGFKRGTTERLCALVTQKASAIGISNLPAFHTKAKERGSSNIINRIVKAQNRIYFASRSSLEGISLLKALDNPAVDIPSKMYKWSMAGKIGTNKTVLDDMLEKEQTDKITDSCFRGACASLCNAIDSVLGRERPCWNSLFENMVKETIRSGYHHDNTTT